MLGSKVWTFESPKMGTFYIFGPLKAYTYEPNINQKNKAIVIFKSFRPHVVHVYKQSMHITRVKPLLAATPDWSRRLMYRQNVT